MLSKLWFRFAIILSILALCAVTLSIVPIKKGIDLAGGVDLLYELDLGSMKDSHVDPKEMATRLIEVLEKRIDPNGVMGLTWRVVGDDRIEIQMPLATPETRAARHTYQLALEALDARNVGKMQLDLALLSTGAERSAALEKIAPAGSAERGLLDDVVKANDRHASAKAKVDKELAAKEKVSDADLLELNQSQDEYERLEGLLMATNVDIFGPKGVAKMMSDMEDAGNTKAREQFDAYIAQPQFATRSGLFANLMNAHLKLLGQSTGGFDDPEDLKRELRGRGVLEFRIAVRPADGPAMGGTISDAMDQLRRVGPRKAHLKDMRWVEVDADNAPEIAKNAELTDLKQELTSTYKDWSLKLTATVSANGPATRTLVIKNTKTGEQIFNGPVGQAEDRKGIPADLTGAVVDLEGKLKERPPWSPALYPEQEVVVNYEGVPYVLLYADKDHALDHSDPSSPWRLAGASTGNDGGQWRVNFSFDTAGGVLFGKMTSQNVGRPMAILLDDKVISAPNIHTAILGGNGEITFGNSENKTSAQIKNDVDQLVRMLQAGSLDAALKPDPISQQNISSSLGADNIKKGLSSSAIAIIAVAVFMIIYYSLTGGFANIAVIVNLTMLLACLAAFGASLTLPGIAGIVLTLGMAVDSNVLINERIREEVQRGASLWMAVRQGYDKVFWTIFDAHITTSLTCVVLIFIDKVGQLTGKGSGGGAGEVKGFGVTLLIGLMCSMFTALFVTRTLMVAAVKWGILRQIDSATPVQWIKDIVTLQFMKGKWPFLKMLTVSNVDWMGKKYYFWVFSFTITALGMCAFFYRGSDKYDTEFNGGTEVTMTLAVKEGSGLKMPDIEDVRRMVNADVPKVLAQNEATARRDALTASTDADRKVALDRAESLKKMEDEATQANVLEVGETHHTFQVVTTVSGTTASGASRADDFRKALVSTFRDYMDVTPAVQFTDSAMEDPTRPNAMQTAPDFNRAVRPVMETSLDKLVAGAEPVNISKYHGGLAIVLDDISPPQTAEALMARIDAANQGGTGNAAFWKPALIPLETVNATAASGPAGGAAAGKGALVKKGVLLMTDPNISYADGAEDWLAQVARPEWKLVRQALTTSSTVGLSVASFDAAVADAAKAQAVIAMGMSLCLVVIYVWVRFGSIKYGLGAIYSLAHDALMAVSATVLAGLIYQHLPGVAHALLISDFKINLTMIAAYLTIVGYSVNDTIVIFDRIRENRGRGMAPLTTKLVNDSINQCFGRTIWTTFTVFIVVLILYVWGGEGVRGFSFAMLIGVFTGAYSTLAIASPALLSLRSQPVRPTWPDGDGPDGMSLAVSKPAPENVR